MGQDKNQIIAVFRAGLNEFKRPYIESLEEFGQPGKDSEEEPTQDEIQMTARVNEILKIFFTMYCILKSAIENHGVNRRDDLDAKAVCAVFEKNGVFPALKQDSSLQGDLLRYLHSDLREFPYTLNTELINQFKEHGVPPLGAAADTCEANEKGKPLELVVAAETGNEEEE